MEIEIKPNVGRSMEDIIKERKEVECNDELAARIHRVFSQFQYDTNKIMDVAKILLDSDVDRGLIESIPERAFFGVCANSFEEKKEIVEEAMKAMMGAGITETDEKLTTKRARVTASKKYMDLIKMKLRYQRLEKDCRVLEEAMKMRKEVAQTRSANIRGDLRDPYLSK